MKTSEQGLKLIKKFEGLYLKAYLCPANVPTIGYGHTKTVKRSDIGVKAITEPVAEQLLKGDLSWAENAVNSYVKVPLTQDQFDALVSFTFNCGSGALKNSTLLKKLNKKLYEEIPQELRKWIHANKIKLRGLERRREAEIELWNRNDISGAKPKIEQMAQTVDSPTKPLVKSRTIAGVATAGVGEVIQQTAEQVNYAGDILGSDKIRLIGVAITIAGLAFAFYARLDDYRKGRL